MSTLQRVVSVAKTLAAHVNPALHVSDMAHWDTSMSQNVAAMRIQTVTLSSNASGNIGGQVLGTNFNGASNYVRDASAPVITDCIAGTLTSRLVGPIGSSPVTTVVSKHFVPMSVTVIFSYVGPVTSRGGIFYANASPDEVLNDASQFADRPYGMVVPVSDKEIVVNMKLDDVFSHSLTYGSEIGTICFFFSGLPASSACIQLRVYSRFQFAPDDDLRFLFKMSERLSMHETQKIKEFLRIAGIDRHHHAVPHLSNMIAGSPGLVKQFLDGVLSPEGLLQRLLNSEFGKRALPALNFATNFIPGAKLIKPIVSEAYSSARRAWQNNQKPLTVGAARNRKGKRRGPARTKTRATVRAKLGRPATANFK